jgi:hypothetical protein
MLYESEHDTDEDVEGVCEVEVVQPARRATPGPLPAISGKARYRCTKGDGRFIVRVRLETPIIKDRIVAEGIHRAPKNGGWSSWFTTPEVNCYAYGAGHKFYTDAEHGPHRLSPDGDAQSRHVAACNP